MIFRSTGDILAIYHIDCRLICRASRECRENVECRARRSTHDILATFKRHSLDAQYDARQFSRQSRFSAIFFSKTQRDMRHSNIDCRMIVARRIERRENVA